MFLDKVSRWGLNPRVGFLVKSPQKKKKMRRIEMGNKKSSRDKKIGDCEEHTELQKKKKYMKHFLF